MKNVADLVSSAKTVHSRFSTSKMERETVREWVLGLGEYPEPHAQAIRVAKDWFRPLRTDAELVSLRPQDVEHILDIVEAGARR